MDSRRLKIIPLGCRFVPYDQWFLTHVDPTWKIRHLKQLILARCFDLPFDPRGLGSSSKDVNGARVPSPITFAPDEGHRPISPIKFANPQELRKKKSGVPSQFSAKDDESSVGHHTLSEEGMEEGTEEQGKEAGYEEDDEWDDEEEFDDDDEEDEDDNDDLDTLDDLPSPVFTSAKSTLSVPGLTGASGRIGSFASSSSTSFRGQAPSQPPALDSGVPAKRKRSFNPLSKLGTKDRRHKADRAQQDQEQEEEGIQTGWFTLIRFVTGQVLEDDFPIAWYDLSPHELVEMHSSAPPANFAISSALSHLLFNSPNASILPGPATLSRGHHQNAQSFTGPLIKSGIITSSDAASALASALLIPSSALALTGTHHAASPTSSPLTLHQNLLRTQSQYLATHPPRLTALPRVDLDLYVQPYWEGWVRALRTMTPIDAPRMADAPGPGGRGRFEYPEYSGGMGGAGGVGLVAWETAFGPVEGTSGLGGERVRVRMNDGRAGHPGGKDGRGERWDGYGHHGHSHEGSGQNRDESYLEWKERWAVVKEGYIHLFKSREETVPAHTLALGALIGVRAAEQLATSVHKHGQRINSSVRQPHHARPHPSDHRRSASQPRVSTSTARESTPRSQPQSHQSAHRSKQTHNIEETSREHHSDRPLRAPGMTSQPTSSVDRKSEGSGRPKAGPSRPLTEEEIKAARERDVRREAERAKELERRRNRERREREIESLRKWDDMSLPFSFGKTKDKEKGKGKEKAKGKEKEKDPGKRSAGESRSKEDDGKRMEAERERERARAREKEREWEKEREREREKERERERVKQKGKDRDDRTYVPESRDEAEAAGMRIICAKFQSTAAWERQERERLRNKAALAALEDPMPQPPPRHYTSTGPSLAGAPTTPAIAEESIDNAGREDVLYGPGHGHMHSLAPRKASLPGIGGAASSKQGVIPSVSMASLATTGTASSLGRAESLAIGGSKFGISGLFGKEADEAARREKEDRKREQKERKAREKEQKQLEKEKKKAKRKEEEEEDDFGMGTALSWKTKKSSKVPTGSGSAGTPSSYDSRPQPPPKDVHSIADTPTTVDSEDHARTIASVGTVRPKLTISPNAIPGDNPMIKTDSDSGSPLSVSSPVFAHSTDSEGISDEDNIYGSGKARQGYRYGGYNPSHAKSPQKPIPGAPSTDVDGNKSESSVGHFTAAKVPIASDGSGPQQRNERSKVQKFAHDHRSQEKGKSRATVEEKGEWLVLDLGSEQAFNSLLRIFHRHSSTPAESDFLPPSITATMAFQSNSFNPNEIRSMPNSPIQRHFQPAATFNRSRDNDSLTTEGRSMLGPSLSSTNGLSTTAVPTDADDDFEDIYVPSTPGPSSLHPSSKGPDPDITQIFPSLTVNLSNHHPGMAPALPYPEWRTEVVQRARRYGMREAGRPLELTMYGWGRYFVDMETSAVYSKMRKKEEANRKKLRNSIALFNEIAKPPGPLPSWEDSSDQDDDGEIPSEDTGHDRSYQGVGLEQDWERADSKRRMSTVSHVSTIKAKSQASKPKPPAQHTDDEDSECHVQDSGDVQTERASDNNDSDTMGKSDADAFDAGYAYGLDDEEDALAEGLGSIMGSSEEESEVEWFAWTTDIPRQVLVRQQQAELDRIREEKLREERDLNEFEAQPLSPMEFSNPFSGDNSSFISQNVALPTVLPPIPPPKTPEEERRQYAEKRRKLEPSAVSTSLPPPVPSLPVSPRLSPGGARVASHHPTTSTSSFQSNQHTRVPSHTPAQGGYHAQRLSNYSSTLSSPSSSESLGFARYGRVAAGAAPINVGAANSARNHSNPMSPLGGVFSPVDDEFGPASSSTTPPSVTGYSYGPKAHRRGHSRSISGSTGGDNESASGSGLRPDRLMLHHSVSMPFSSNAPVIPAGSSPHSPTRTTAERTLAQPISMPILTPAQISQIEAEMEEKLLRNAQMREQEREATSLVPSPSTSPPSSSYGHLSPRESSASSYVLIPRRSSSAGVAPTGSPPSSSGLGRSIGRSSSVLVRPLQPQPDEPTRERGVLRKKRSDLGKNTTGNDVKEREQSPSPNAKQRPTISIVGLSTNNSSSNTTDAQSPTQRRHPRGPRPAHPETQDINPSSSVGPSGASTSTYQSAKALLRRVRSGSSLGMDMRIEEVSPHAELAQPSWPPSSPPPSTVITNPAEAGTSADGSTPSRKKMGAMDRIVRGLDSALDFVDGR